MGGAIPLTDVYSAKFSLLDWAKQVMDMPKDAMPLVHSVSYGNDEIQQTSLQVRAPGCVRTIFSKQA